MLMTGPLPHNQRHFHIIEGTLSRDMGYLNECFDYWKRPLNANKTVATSFHVDNKQAAIKLKVTLAGEVLVHDFAPKYLSVTLDRSLTYRKHTENVRDKVKSSCNIFSKLPARQVSFVMELLTNRSFTLRTSDGQVSRLRRIHNGVPQGSTLAPTLFIYISDIPKTTSKQYYYGYADDLALLAAHHTSEKVEETLNQVSIRISEPLASETEHC